ncbi:hypothetical protein KYK29_17510 [Shinella daejeonensis]|nr:hypothetical protein [Shinella daejeonensis]MCP8896726.1 hypothetical protein [Shinella daejeonensis]
MADRGAHYHCCDFQVHSPRDLQWNGGNHVTEAERMAYAARLVEACREKGLNAIAVTDHHDMAFVPFVKRAALAETDANGALLPEDIDNLSRNQDIAVGLQVILKPRARPTPTWTSMPERTLDFEF